MINLNDESYDSKPGKQIFNNGVAGVVENVTVSIEKKKPEDKEKAPEYKVNFTDADGGVVNLSFWYVTEATKWKTVDEQIKAQAKSMKHLLHAMLGKETSLPSFSTPKEMLDGCMKMVHEASKAGTKFRVYANYGNTENPAQYIQMRSWVPFMQAMSDTEELLKKSSIENLIKITPDGATSTGTATSAAAVVDDWD